MIPFGARVSHEASWIGRLLELRESAPAFPRWEPSSSIARWGVLVLGCSCGLSKPCLQNRDRALYRPGELEDAGRHPTNLFGPLPMPEIQIGDRSIACEVGDNLRQVLLRAELPLYNGLAGAIHCRGIGTCGTCAIAIEGAVSPMTRIERWRLGFPPHCLESGLRLACQCRVLGDLNLVKHAGLWGHKTHFDPDGRHVDD